VFHKIIKWHINSKCGYPGKQCVQLNFFKVIKSYRLPVKDQGKTDEHEWEKGLKAIFIKNGVQRQSMHPEKIMEY